MNSVQYIEKKLPDASQYLLQFYDSWGAGGTDVYFYTELKSVSDMIKKDFKRFAIYTLRGKIIAWQFCFPKRLERIMISRISKLLENEARKINDLQG